MRSLAILLVLLFVLPASAQAPHPVLPVGEVVHTPLTIYDTLRGLQDVNPEYARVYSIGQTVAGQDIWAIDIVHPEASLNDALVFYLDANHHGNEQLGAESVILFLEELMEWSLTEEGAERLQQVRVVATPLVNADGTTRDARVNLNGVDLNRNYPYHWGLYGTGDTPNPATGNYRGESPGSEPETQANVAFMQEIRPDLYFSMHTGSHDIVLPWRQEPDADGPIPDWPAYQALLSGIEEVSGLGYRDPSGAGESISWAYGDLGAVSLVVEVDTTQNQPVFTEWDELLEEEVAIYWYGLEHMEHMGGHLVYDPAAGTVTNMGWGNATNVSQYRSGLPGANGEPGRGGISEGDGAPVSDGRHGEALGPNIPDEPGDILQAVLPPGGSIEVAAGVNFIVYEARVQGDSYKEMRLLPVTASLAEEEGRQDTPFLPVILVLALLALAVRRRPA